MSTLEDLTAKYDEQVAKMQEGIKTEMKNAFKEFFNDNPNIEALVWTQFTPYFNDGDACVFHVQDFFPASKEELQQLKDDEIDIWDLDCYPSSELQKQARPFTNALHKIDDAIFLSAFGDHCQVIATREGFDVDEYQHD